MPEPSLPDPRLRKVLEQVDQLKRELRAERVRSGNLRHALAKARMAADAKPVQEQRPARVSAV
jgi:hypothetical protein